MGCGDDLLEQAAKHLAVAVKLALWSMSDERLRAGLGRAARNYWRTGWRLFRKWLESLDVGASRFHVWTTH
jgi:hypothetical protein